MKKTALYNKHILNNGKLIDFFGWTLPVDYGSALNETKSVRSRCGVFDASHMGELVVSGDGACEYLESVLSNNITDLKEGRLRYNLLLDSDGSVLDDLMVYRRANDYFCVVNAINIDKDFAYIEGACPSNVTVINESEKVSLVCVQGPLSEKVLATLVGDGIRELRYMSFGYYELAGLKVMVSRSGYTGEDGFEIYVNNADAEVVWSEIFNAGEEYGILPCGLASRDILRVEAGYPLYGHELSSDINLFEVGVGWAIKQKESYSMGVVLDRLKAKASRVRVGIVMVDRGVLREGYDVFFDDKKIGMVTSGTYSPNLNQSIGMAYIEKKHNVMDKTVFVEIRGRKIAAVIKKLPFVVAKTKR